MKSKLMIYAVVLFCIISNIYSQSIDEIVNDAVKGKELKNGQWSVYAKYVDNNNVIYAKDENYSLAPASGLKVFTSSTALEVLGEDFRFQTKLYFDGSIIKGSILKGNIYIVGGGDPTLGSSLVKGSLNLDTLFLSWITILKEKGIQRIEGSIIADDLLYEDNPISDGWVYGDIGNYYGAGANALTINDNLYYVYFKPGKNVGNHADVLRTEPVIDGLTFTNYMKTGKEGSGDNGNVYSAPYQYNVTLRGTIPLGVKEFSIKGAIPDPALFAAQYFTKALIKAGIKVSKPAKKIDKPIKYNSKNLITTTYSPMLKDIVYIVNKRSNNLYTEMLLRAIGLNKKGEGSIDKGIEGIEEYLSSNGVNIDGLHLYDGCGLARSNTITAKLMVDVLALEYSKKSFNSFYNSLGVTGDPNDISYYSKYGVGTELAFNGHIKSGLINRVRSHSGYIKDKSGRTIIFSFIANNFTGSSSQIDKIHISLMVKLAQLSEK
ncbi:MAG: D-alanyl-D-alanine carboxypeptidase/D-alanyl-D-alanine-endopeptidase [bacterium]